jgi:hypothetical protein
MAVGMIKKRGDQLKMSSQTHDSKMPDGYYGLQYCLRDLREHHHAAQKDLRRMAQWAEDYNLQNPLAGIRPRLVVDNTKPVSTEEKRQPIKRYRPPEPTDAA